MTDGARHWAIGDVHGHAKTLAALWPRLDFDLTGDRLWLVGDLVNRGPDSLGALRWARSMASTLGDRFACVLGNHDLHLLAAAAGRREPGEDLRPILDAPDAADLLEWLRFRPLAVREGGRLLVHAGLWPTWSVDETLMWARRLEGLLRGGSTDLLTGGKALLGKGEIGEALYALTTLRLLRTDGRPSTFKGPPDDAPPGDVPWFEAPHRRWRGLEVVCGHWAALGVHRRAGVVCALDSGVAWGGPLTAIRLDDGELVQQEPVG
ncbi:MAG: symmetrical bis(5'-nucleosyl)-tetraphosphatase [Acidobacteriota bacterium]